MWQTIKVARSLSVEGATFIMRSPGGIEVTDQDGELLRILPVKQRITVAAILLPTGMLFIGHTLWKEAPPRVRNRRCGECHRRTHDPTEFMFTYAGGVVRAMGQAKRMVAGWLRHTDVVPEPIPIGMDGTVSDVSRRVQERMISFMEAL